jgi:hypothetical protein
VGWLGKSLRAVCGELSDMDTIRLTNRSKNDGRVWVQRVEVQAGITFLNLFF